MDKILSRFTDEEKIRSFDIIAAKYFDRNFGTMTKSDIDTLMFSQLISHLQLHKTQYSDYSLSKELGISQSRIRGLRINQQLKYPKDLDWQDDFAKCIENAIYDEKTATIKVSIPDPNVLLEIRNVVEQTGGYVDVQLNNKLLQVRLEHYVRLLIFLEGSMNENEVLEKINVTVNKYKKMEEKITKETLGDFLKNESLSMVSEIIGSFIPYSGVVKSLAESGVKLISRYI